MKRTGIFIAVAGFGALLATQALADRCRVMDPTGTPLNVRAAPQGRVVGRVPNGKLVQMIETEDDSRGRIWARVTEMDGRPLGWVFREFVSCF